MRHQSRTTVLAGNVAVTFLSVFLSVSTTLANEPLYIHTPPRTGTSADGNYVSIVRRATRDGDALVTVETATNIKDSHRAGPAQIKIIDLKTETVRSSLALGDHRWLRVMRDAEHVAGVRKDGAFVAYHVANGEVACLVQPHSTGAMEWSGDGQDTWISDDLSFMCMRHPPDDRFALSCVALKEPVKVVGRFAKGPYQVVSSLLLANVEGEGRVAVIMIPKVRPKRSWKLLLMDTEFRELGEMNVPSGTQLRDIRGGRYPMALLVNGPNWTLLSLDQDILQAVRSGKHNPTGHPKAFLYTGAISPDGQWLVTILYSRTSRLGIWSVATGTLVRELRLKGFARGCRFNSTGNRLSCGILIGLNRSHLAIWDFKALIADTSSGKTRGMQQSQDPRMGGFRSNGQLNRPGAFDQRNRRNRR